MTQPPSTASHTAAGQAPGLHAELPFDPAPFVWPVTLMAPRHVESPTAAEQLPFLFWLCGALAPRMVVDIGAVDATVHFGLCQAVDALSLDARCLLGGIRLDLSVRKDSARIQRWIEHQNSHHGSRSQIIGGGHGNLLGQLDRQGVDLLVLHARAATSGQLQQWKKEFWPMLSPQAVVLVDGIGDGPHEFFDALATEGPGFRFAHGTGFGVVAPGSAPPGLIHHLSAQTNDDAAAEGLRDLFQRLGLGCRQAADHRLLNRFRTKFTATDDKATGMRETVGLLEARLVGRESEILELRDRLDWHRGKLHEAEQDLVVVRAEALRVGNASASLERELRRMRKDLARHEDAGKQSLTALDDAKRQLQKERRKVTVLRDQLQAMYSSRSWKITAPLRRLISKLKPDSHGD